MKLEEVLAPWSGCSQTKGNRKSIKPYTTTRAVKPEGGALEYLAGGKPVQTPGCTVHWGKEVHDDYQGRIFEVYQGVSSPQ